MRSEHDCVRIQEEVGIDMKEQVSRARRKGHTVDVHCMALKRDEFLDTSRLVYSICKTISRGYKSISFNLSNSLMSI